MTTHSEWQVISLQDVSSVPWRNGGGTTRQLVAWPEAQSWQWRMSVAEVARSGLFSSFAGVRRWFAVLDGDGVCLTVSGVAHRLDANSDPLAFDGAAQTVCEMLGGSTQDFNLMVQGDATGCLQRVQSVLNTTVNAPKVIAVYAHKMGASVLINHKMYELPAFSLGWMTVTADASVCITASNALFMEISA